MSFPKLARHKHTVCKKELRTSRVKPARMQAALLLLGEEELRYGEYSIFEPVPGVVGGISVGADPDSPGLRSKGNKGVPNEDSALLVIHGDVVLLAVADAHFGREASHAVLQRLQEVYQPCSGPGELGFLCLGLGEPPWPPPSATTLLIAQCNRATGQVFGLGWGDSRLQTVGPSGVRVYTQEDQTYLHSGDAPDPFNADRFEFTLQSDEILLLQTDGIHECHYGSAVSSVGEEEIRELYSRHGESLREFADVLMQTALQGVRGCPGGQDNIALTATRRL